jgi:hypothetical protein
MWPMVVSPGSYFNRAWLNLPFYPLNRGNVNVFLYQRVTSQPELLFVEDNLQ